MPMKSIVEDLDQADRWCDVLGDYITDGQQGDLEKVLSTLDGTKEQAAVLLLTPLFVLTHCIYQRLKAVEAKAEHVTKMATTAAAPDGEPLISLESRLKVIEAKQATVAKGLEYRGVYDDSVVYAKGDVVTRGGSMWVCKKDHLKAIQPDDKSTIGLGGWQLCVARGKEGKPGPRGETGAPGRDLRWEQ